MPVRCNRKLLLAVVATAALSGGARADTFSRGGVSLESRVFNPDDEEETEDYGVALTTQLEVKYTHDPLVVQLRGTARLDALDNTRNIVNLEEAYVGYSAGPLGIRAGAQLLNWTATEVFHPADIINSRNFDSDPEDQEKLGEPMVELRLRIFNGYLSAYYLPMRIAPHLVGSESRLSIAPVGSPPVGDAVWVNRNGKRSDALFYPQGAVSLSQTIGPADFALQVIDHNDRSQPTIIFDIDNMEVRPVYHSVTHVGLTYTQVIGSLLVKLEAAHRVFRDPAPVDNPIDTLPPQVDHDQIAGGIEYGWTTTAGHDATVIVEGQFVPKARAVRQQLSLFQADGLIGYRHAFNDAKARELLLVFITDFDRPYEYITAASYSQRISDTWSIAGTLRSLRILELPADQEAEFTLTRNF